MFKTGNLRAEC